MPGSHTVLSELMGGAAVYVGMTRGRETNTLYVVGVDMADARKQFIEAMERDRADRRLTDATERAAGAVHGLVSMVNAEIARLVRVAERAERAAESWERIAERLGRQRATHHAEDEQSTEVIRAAETYLAAVTNESTAAGRVATVGRFGRLALLAQELGAERVRRDPIRARFIRPAREARNAHADCHDLYSRIISSNT